MATPTPPDRSRCPVCGNRLGSSRCDGCGAELRGPLGTELWDVDRRLHQLGVRRVELVGQLRAVARVAAPAPSEVSGWAAPSPAAASPVDRRPPPPGWAAPPPGPAPWPGPQADAGAPFPPAAPPARPAYEEQPAGPEVSSILLGLGVTLLVLAALVFAAVSWNRIGPLGQGALLVGLTAAVAFGTDRAARRGLTGTAEALGVLTVVLGPLVAQAVRLTVDLPQIDDRTWSNWSSWSWWPAAIVVIGVAAIGFGRAVGVRSPRYLGVALVQIGLPIWVALAPVSPFVVVLVLLAQATLVAMGPAFRDRDASVRRIWGTGATLTWLTASLLALGWGAVDGDEARRVAAVVALTASAASAGVITWRSRDRAELTGAAALGAAVLTHLAIGRALIGVVDDAAVWAMEGVIAAGGLLVADRLRGPAGSPAAARSAAVATVSSLVAAIAALPVLVLGAAAASAALSGAPWRSVAGHGVEVNTWSVLDPAWATMLAGLGALGLGWAAAHRWLARSVVAVGLAGLAAIAAVTVPVLAGAPVAVVGGLALAAAVVLAGAAWRPASRGLAAASASSLLIGLVWAAPNPGLALVAVAVAAGLGLAAVVRGTRVDDAVLAGAGATLGALAVVVDAAVAVHVGLIGSWDDGSTPWTRATAAIVAALLGAGLPVLDRVILAPRRAKLASTPAEVTSPAPPPAPAGPAAGPEADPGALPGWALPSGWLGPAPAAGASPVPSPSRAHAAEVVAPVAGAWLAGAHVVALLGISSAGGQGARSVTTATSLALAAGAAALGLVAALLARRTPRWWWWAAAAGAEALVLTWYRLAEAEVATVEAYTLPAASLVGVVAWLAARSRPGGVASARSWELEGVALALALGPTAAVALADPGVARQAIGLVAGAVLLASGATWRRRAPIDVGAVAVVVLGLQVLAPYAAEIPRWISLGAVGAVLVALGATFEERRRDLHQARRRYASLR